MFLGRMNAEERKETVKEFTQPMRSKCITHKK